MDFVWNRGLAEYVRAETEAALKQQTKDMRSTKRSYTLNAYALDLNAIAQDVIARTAMRIEWGTDSDGNSYSSLVPDLAKRAEAAQKAAAYREQAEALRVSIGELAQSIENLETAITTSNDAFNRMFDDAQSEDRLYTGQIQQSVIDIDAYRRMIEGIRDSFSDSFMLSGLLMSVAGLGGLTSTSVLDSLLAAKFAGFSLCAVYGGDPVNMATGNFIYSKEDIKIPGRYPLAFERFYNAIGGASGSVLGPGWTHNYNIRLLHEDDTVCVFFGDGHSEAYEDLQRRVRIAT